MFRVDFNGPPFRLPLAEFILTGEAVPKGFGYDVPQPPFWVRWGEVKASSNETLTWKPDSSITQNRIRHHALSIWRRANGHADYSSQSG